MICRDTNIRSALKSRQRGFLLNPHRFGGVAPPASFHIEHSLRFRGNAPTYLSRSSFNTPTNAKIGTASFWCKKSWLATAQYILTGYNPSNAQVSAIYLGAPVSAAGSQLVYRHGGSVQNEVYSTAVMRDPAAWYHCVVNFTATSGVVNMYLNGLTLVTTGTIPNTDTQLCYNNANNRIGATHTAAIPNDGFLADFYYIDGQALDASYFGEFDSNGIWVPKAYTGTYGNNGYHLDFSDTGALTSGSNAGLGKDSSGNGLYWNTNGHSITGALNDACVDSPSRKDASVANYCTWNPLYFSPISVPTTPGSLAEANLTMPFISGAAYSGYDSTVVLTTGKWYMEATLIAGGSGGGGGLYLRNADTMAQMSGVTGLSVGSYTAGDVVAIALDMDAGTFRTYRNNTLVATQTFTANTPALLNVSVGNCPGMRTNFGQRPFVYTPPTGHVAINATNLSAASITPSEHFQVLLGSGASILAATQALYTNELSWTKDRQNAVAHQLVDSVRGANALFSESTNAEAAYTTRAGNSWGLVWRASDNAPVSNTNGSITSSVSANTAGGFSILTYTGTGATATVGHGLGIAPKLIIIKAVAAVRDWPVYHASMGNTRYLHLNSTADPSPDSTYWNNTSPTTSVFTIGTNTNVNSNGVQYVAYCFAEIPGLSKIGQFAGNSSTDGPFVNCGFKPRFLLFRRYNATGAAWIFVDSVRNLQNVLGLYGVPSSNAAEPAATTLFDFLSNGFKCRVSGGGINVSGNNTTYYAIADTAFRNTNAF